MMILYKLRRRFFYIYSVVGVSAISRSFKEVEYKLKLNLEIKDLLLIINLMKLSEKLNSTLLHRRYIVDKSNSHFILSLKYKYNLLKDHDD